MRSELRPPQKYDVRTYKTIGGVTELAYLHCQENGFTEIGIAKLLAGPHAGDLAVITADLPAEWRPAEVIRMKFMPAYVLR
jgi:hypothetical protein